jgi:hypothetical protein
MSREIQSLGDNNPHPIQTIAEKLGPQGAGLVVGLMERNRAEADAILDRINEGKDADIERLTKERNDAWAHIARIERRVQNLLFAPESPLDEQGWE